MENWFPIPLRSLNIWENKASPTRHRSQVFRGHVPERSCLGGKRYSLDSCSRYSQSKNVICVVNCPVFKYSIAKAQLLLWRVFSFCFILSELICLNRHHSLALGYCWFADCNQKQWALDGEPELHSAVGFTHLMSKYTEALCLKPDGNTVLCSHSCQTKSRL